MKQMLLKLVKIPVRVLRKLMAPKGQMIARGCVYVGMIDLAITLLLMAHTRWALPFLIASFLFTIIGMTAISHRRISQVSFYLCLTCFQTLGPGLFDLNQQADQQNRLQQQLIILENQRIELFDQQVTLKIQLPLLARQQQGLEQAGNKTDAKKQKEAIDKTNSALADVKTGLHSVDNFIAYDYWLIEENAWNLPSDGLSKDNRQMITNDGQEIQNNRDRAHNLQQRITDNNALLPGPERVQTSLQNSQKTCVTGYPCGIPSWQETLIANWQYISRQPLSETWLFWLVLLGGMLILFVIAPKNTRRGKEISYKILYNGLSSQLRDPAKRARTAEAYPYLVKLRVWITAQALTLNKDYQRDYIYFDFGSETTIYDVYLLHKSITRRGQNQLPNVPQVAFGTSKGKMLLQPMQRDPQRTLWGLIHTDLYIAVDHPIRSLSAEASVSGLERLRELRGPAYLVELTKAMYELDWLALAFSLYFCLLQCSRCLFDGISFLPGLIPCIGLGLFLLWLVFKGIEFAIEKTALRVQKVHGELVPAAMQSRAIQADDA